MATLDDGKGRGFSASVSEDQRLAVEAKVKEREFYVSRDDGQAYSISSNSASKNRRSSTFQRNTGLNLAPNDPVSSLESVNPAEAYPVSRKPVLPVGKVES